MRHSCANFWNPFKCYSCPFYPINGRSSSIDVRFLFVTFFSFVNVIRFWYVKSHPFLIRWSMRHSCDRAFRVIRFSWVGLCSLWQRLFTRCRISPIRNNFLNLNFVIKPWFCPSQQTNSINLKWIMLYVVSAIVSKIKWTHYYVVCESLQPFSIATCNKYFYVLPFRCIYSVPFLLICSYCCIFSNLPLSPS